MANARRRRRDRGQALVEAALVAPLFFMIFFGVIDLARVIWANDVVTNAAREGARFASVHAGVIQEVVAAPATPDEIRDHARQFLIAAGYDATITVCFSEVSIASETPGCTGDDSGGVAYDRGNMVTVRVESHVPVLAGALVGHGDFIVSGESTVLINN